jgi:mxaL protein
MSGMLRTLRAGIDARCWLLLAAIALLVVALGRPTLAAKREVFNALFVLDITQSMNTRDYLGGAQSRLAVAKDAVQRAMLDMPCGSKVGLAVFTEYRSFLLLAPVEVCANYAELAASLAHIDGTMAWAGGSEIAKGLNWGLRIIKELDPRPSLVFVTDGHEAPPLNARNRPKIDAQAGEVRGVIVGAGGTELAPIPKLDFDGNALGFWRADEVLQTDIYSSGRGASVSGEKMADADPSPVSERSAGTEHLSSLKETYLQGLASETGLAYHRLLAHADLVEVLQAAALGEARAVAGDLAWLPAALALASLAACFAWRERVRTT